MDREIEHTIIEKAGAAISYDKFREYFANACGYRGLKNKALRRPCNTLSKADSIYREMSALLRDGKVNHNTTYLQLGQPFVGGQDSHLQQNLGVTQPHWSHLRFWYQTV